MLVIIFEYYHSSTGTCVDDSIEVEKYQDFKDWISDNGIKNYEILDIIVEN